MIHKRRNNRINKYIFNQFTYFIVGVIVLILVLFPLSEKIAKQYRLNQEIGELNKEVARLEGKNSDFKNIIGYLESDEFAEEEARMNLNLKKEGEEVVIIKTKNDNMKKIAAKHNKQQLTGTKNPGNWWNYFLK